MQKKWIITTIGGILATGAAFLVAANTSWLTGTVDQKFDTLASIQPGLGKVMIEYSKRFANIYYSAQVGNWGMAAYQLKEMVEIQEVGETTRPARADALKGMEQNGLKPLAVDIINQDIKTFKADFSTAVAYCNACHAATGFDYIVYKLPDKPRVPANLNTGLAFTADQLKPLLASLVGPAITSGSLVNGASFALAPAPVAPGSIISIFGVNLAPSEAFATGLPLPTQLAGTTVTVNGNPIPLIYVNSGQINAQLPFEVSPGMATVVVNTSLGTSGSQTFNVASAAVGIFQVPGSNRAAALNQDFSANGPQNPEARGRVIQVFLTGLGPVSPTVPTGQPAPASPLSSAVLPVTATIGGSTATVQFVGLAPGFAGLAQANVQIPTGIAPGDQLMIISVNGQAGNTVMISVK